MRFIAILHAGVMLVGVARVHGLRRRNLRSKPGPPPVRFWAGG
jgi:hypothetical protein